MEMTREDLFIKIVITNVKTAMLMPLLVLLALTVLEKMLLLVLAKMDFII